MKNTKNTQKRSWKRALVAIVLATFGATFCLQSLLPAYAEVTTGVAVTQSSGTGNGNVTAAPATVNSTGGSNTTLAQAATNQAASVTGNPNASVQYDDQIKKLQQNLNIPEDVAKFLINLIVMVSIVLKMLYALLVPILGMIGKFMSNDWVTGSVFRLDVLIETLWQFIRNLVNIIIVLYLVYVAGRNIMPFGNDSQYDIKQVLPKVALALVIVNFSLLFCRTVLSVANITTTMAFSMPQQIGSTVFEGFNAVPVVDGSNKLVEAASPNFNQDDLAAAEALGFIDGSTASTVGSGEGLIKQYQWEKNGKPVDGIPFNPFVWAEPLGKQEQANLTSGCESDERLDVQTFQGYATTYCVKPKDASKPIISRRRPTVPTSGSTVYAMECLHKNYAFNFSESLFSNAGPTLIANPGYNPDTGSYVLQPDHYKRILIQEEFQAMEDKKISSGAWQTLYANKQAETLAQAMGAGTQYPYYSDCVTSLDDLAFSSRNAMYVFAFNLLRIPSYEKSFTDIQNYADVTVRIFMSFFFLLMFFGVTIAMLVAMVARTFYIWVMMALSPLWVLTDVLKIWRGEDVDEEGVIGGYGKFIALAFLPTLLGVILSVGFLMYNFLTYIAGLENSVRGRFNVGSISLWFDPGTAVGGVGDLFATMFGLFALAALWVAVFAAFKFGFKSMKLVGKTLESINGAGKAAAGFATRLPMDAQVLPIGKGGQRVSLGTLSQVPNKLKEGFEMKQRDRRADEIRSLNLDPSNRVSDTERSQLQVNINQASNKNIDQVLAALDSDKHEIKQLRDTIMGMVFNKDGTMKKKSDLKEQTVDVDGKKYTISREMLHATHDKFQPNSAELGRAYRASYNAISGQEFFTKEYKMGWEGAYKRAYAEAAKSSTTVTADRTGIKFAPLNGKEKTYFGNSAEASRVTAEVNATKNGTVALDGAGTLTKQLGDAAKFAKDNGVSNADFKNHFATYMQALMPASRINFLNLTTQFGSGANPTKLTLDKFIDKMYGL